MTRFWDGVGWTAQTAAAAPPPYASPPPYTSAPPPYAGATAQGSAQGWGPRPGGLLASVFPARPGEAEDAALVRAFASYERLSGWVWIAFGILQVIFVFTIIAGAWNIYAGITRLKAAPTIEARHPSVPASFEPLTGYVIIGVINLVLGGFLGLAFLAADLYVRDQVLKNRQLFAGYAPPATPWTQCRLASGFDVC